MPRSTWTILSEDYSLFEMRIVGFKARLGLYRTRLGETHERGPFICADWERLVGEAHLVVIEWLRPSGDWIERGIGSRLWWDDSVVSGL